MTEIFKSIFTPIWNTAVQTAGIIPQVLIDAGLYRQVSLALTALIGVGLVVFSITPAYRQGFNAWIRELSSFSLITASNALGVRSKVVINKQGQKTKDFKSSMTDAGYAISQSPDEDDAYTQPLEYEVPHDK